MKKILVLVAWITLCFISGCATIVSKTSYPVYIHSEPKGATVVITDKHDRQVYKGITPASVTLRSGAGYFSKARYYVQLNLAGYDEKIVPISFDINAWYFGNIIIGGFIGLLIVDPLTGAMWRIRDPLVDEILVKSVTRSGSGPQLQVIDIKTIPENLVSRPVRIP